MDKKELDIYQNLLRKLSNAFDLSKETLLRHDELKELKEEVKALYETSSDKFKDSTWGRKTYKIIQSGDFLWTKIPKAGSGGFFGLSDTRWLIELREAINEFLEKNDKTIKRFENDEFWLQSNKQSGDEHIMIGSKKSQKKSHLIVDYETGEIRIDPKDRSPHDLLKGIKTTLTNKSGGQIEITETSINFSQGSTDEADTEKIEDKLQRAKYHVMTRLEKKGGRASFDYIREKVDETYSDEFLKKLIDLNPKVFGRCEVKSNGKIKNGITLDVVKSDSE